MIGMQDEDAVERAREHRVDLVFLARHREAHAQEVRRVVEVVLRIDEGLADRIFVGHRGERRHLRDHAHRGDHALMRIGDVGRVVIEGRQRADAGHHDRHRMRVAAEALEEPVHLLVHHGVARDAVVEIGLLRRGRQLAVEQQVAGLEEVAVLGELLDRIAAIEQHALVAVDIGDRGLAARRRGEARIVGEHPGLGVELRDVDDARADRAVLHRAARPACCRRMSVAEAELMRLGPFRTGGRAIPRRRRSWSRRLSCRVAGSAVGRIGRLGSLSVWHAASDERREARGHAAEASGALSSIWSCRRARVSVPPEHGHDVEQARRGRPAGERGTQRLRHLAELDADAPRRGSRTTASTLGAVPVGNGAELARRCRRGARGPRRSGPPPFRRARAGAGHRGNRRCREVRRGSWRAPSGPAWRR